MSGNKSRNLTFPILGVLAGIVFIIAGIAALVHLEPGVSIALIFVIAGAAIVLIGLAGFRARGWDIALFVIGLIVLANVVGSNYYQQSTNVVHSYSVSRSEVNASRIDLVATAGFGSINVQFSNNADLAYQAVFRTTIFGFPFINPAPNEFGLTNSTTNGELLLNATSSTGSITVTLGMSYAIIINATSSTGSIQLSRPSSGLANIQAVSLVTSTGSVDAQIEGRNISGIVIGTSTGSVNFVSNYLSPSGARVPIAITASTGSVNINMKVANNAAIGIDATDNLGSISHQLSGFSISQDSNKHLVASAGDITSAEKSFLVSTHAETGSISIVSELVSPQQ